MYTLFSYPAVKNASNEAEPDFHSQGIGLYKYLYSHPLKDALLINNQDITLIERYLNNMIFNLYHLTDSEITYIINEIKT